MTSSITLGALAIHSWAFATVLPHNVMVGGNIEDEACPATGVPKYASAKVFARPDGTADIVAQIQARNFFYICETVQNRTWTGIVFRENPASQIDCMVSRPVITRSIYQGPCAQGWIKTELVEPYAE